MRSLNYYRYSIRGLILGMLFANSAAQAHPHHWIDLFTEWQFNPNGLITGVKLRWLFDDYYSVLLVEDTAATGKELQLVLDKILNNIGQHHYFLQIEQQGAEAELGVAEQARIDLQDHRVEIEFLLPIKIPLDPWQSEIVYRIAEPTYYFEMLHAEEGPAIVLKDAPPTCRYNLAPPKPDAALVAYAATLGINESGGNNLGNQFAETVTIRCE
ncbi:MAG: DUF1007 family protein [Candidatus Thiodiazotropha sp. (ex Ctena orbiculata)]|nr:DUF1007 family protein [Candidatus Thiodiazotropha taylori]